MSAAMLQGAVSTAELAVTGAAVARTQVRQAVASNQTSRQSPGHLFLFLISYVSLADLQNTAGFI
jgi:hypothetical protein